MIYFRNKSTGLSFLVVGVMGVDMRRIVQANIDRLNKLLETETDPTKRTMERRLLVEEKANLKKLPAYNKNEAKAY